MSTEPLGHRSYGSIAHLAGSQIGHGDYCVPEGQANIATKKTRDRHDVVVLQEKVDGTNVAVARIGDEIVPIVRAGHLAASAPRFQHRLFAAWAIHHAERFLELLQPGERVAGEWLYMSHGIRYVLPHSPFVAFDLMTGHERQSWGTVIERLAGHLRLANTLHVGAPIGIQDGLALLGKGGHGSVELPEGLVWRVERQGKVDFMAKYVRPEFVPGRYFRDDGAEVPNAFRPEDAQLLNTLGYSLGVKLSLPAS